MWSGGNGAIERRRKVFHKNKMKLSLFFFEKLKGKENTSTIPNFILLVRINRRRLLLSRSTFAAIYSKQFPRQSKKRAKNHNYPLPVGAFLRSIIVRIVRKPSNN
jgi:hypothetical protein